MKKYFSLTVACIALLITSCSKDDVNGTIANSTNSANTLSQAALPLLNLTPKNTVNYGALIDAPSAKGSLDFQLNVADQLGISCIRSRTYVPGTFSVSILNSNYNIVLNFNSDYNGTPIPFVRDMVKYEADLKNVLAGFAKMPVVAVIENEESNKTYYSGTPEEYIRQLNTAINVMHARGIKVANGGLTDVGLNYLVYQDLVAQGKADSAARFKERAKVTPKSASTQERGAYINTLLSNYTRMNLDYVNFHWKGKSPDVEAFNQVINYLKKRTGKQIISNELGQFDSDPATLSTHIQLCTDQDMPYVLWYSPDESKDKKAVSLHHNDQSLTPSGINYQNYLKK